jgi:hypothetical protein
MAMVPHERSLVKRLESQPFALLGVDFDATREKCHQAEVEKKITWRSWFNGPVGPISQQYHITDLPTIFVLDANGVIRYKNVDGKAMDEAVEALLKESPSAGGGAK